MLGWHKGARSLRQLLKMAFIQASTAAIKIGVRGNILGEPFPISKVCLEAYRHEGWGAEGPCCSKRRAEDPEDSTEQEEPGCSGNGSPCLSPLPCSFHAASHRAKA